MSEPFSYSIEDNLWQVNVFAGVSFQERRQITEAFGACHKFWSAHIKKPAYALVDYTGTAIEKSLIERFAEERRKIVDECTITTFRFTNDLTARTTIRAMSIKIHQPSNLYASREEALAVLKNLRSGLVTLAADL